MTPLSLSISAIGCYVPLQASLGFTRAHIFPVVFLPHPPLFFLGSFELRNPYASHVIEVTISRALP